MAESRIERAARECVSKLYQYVGKVEEHKTVEGCMEALIREAAAVADASSGIGTAGAAIRRHYDLAQEGEQGAS